MLTAVCCCFFHCKTMFVDNLGMFKALVNFTVFMLAESRKANTNPRVGIYPNKENRGTLLMTEGFQIITLSPGSWLVSQWREPYQGVSILWTRLTAVLGAGHPWSEEVHVLESDLISILPSGSFAPEPNEHALGWWRKKLPPIHRAAHLSHLMKGLCEVEAFDKNSYGIQTYHPTSRDYWEESMSQ